MTDEDRTNRLGAYLRARRDLVSPAMAGLPAGDNRRVPGLRREEVAMLAGISADYYLRLERGRDANPSVQVLESLARVLQLDDVERAYLIGLGTGRPRARRSRTEERVPERLRHLLTCDVVVALPGGIGTLSEAAIVWAAAQTEPDAAQLVLVGDEWADVHRAVGEDLVVDPADLALARCVGGVDDVVDVVRAALSAPRANRGPRG